MDPPTHSISQSQSIGVTTSSGAQQAWSPVSLFPVAGPLESPGLCSERRRGQRDLSPRLGLPSPSAHWGLCGHVKGSGAWPLVPVLIHYCYLCHHHHHLTLLDGTPAFPPIGPQPMHLYFLSLFLNL